MKNILNQIGIIIATIVLTIGFMGYYYGSMTCVSKDYAKSTFTSPTTGATYNLPY